MSDYPTQEQLDDLHNTVKFEEVCEKVGKLWAHKDRYYFDGDTMVISTGGWSGNEDVVSYLPMMFHVSYYTAWANGGHHVYSRASAVRDKAIELLYRIQDNDK